MGAIERRLEQLLHKILLKRWPLPFNILALNNRGCFARFFYFSRLLQSAKGVTGCRQQAEIPDTGAYQLNGARSNIELDIGTPLQYGLSRLDLTFSTLSKDGLIFLGMDPPVTAATPEGNFAFDATPVNFYALQIEDGYLVSLFDFGTKFERVEHKSIGRVNDGNVHNVTLKAKNRKFVRIWVDTTREGPKVADVILTKEQGHKFKASRAFIGGIPMQEYTPHP